MFKLTKYTREVFNKRLNQVALVNLEKHSYVIITEEAYNAITNKEGDAEGFSDLVNYLLERKFIEKCKEEYECKNEYAKISPPEPRLRLVYWEITRYCNLRCKTCYIGKLQGEDLSTKDMFKIIDKITPYKPTVHLSGGEPLIRKDFFKIVDYLKEKGIGKIILLTNGTLINDEIASKIKDYGFHGLQVSVDGGTAKTHDFIRGKGSFEKVMNGLKTLKRYGIENVTVKMTPL